ncbi:hypothetical protein GSI01S_27_00510 [Gordonia sihwensis NBRC 108236]|uniref:Uncharacterized protein n=1 Tax=Gordonia sihwensis NBRC 108236 TaxID=1223544 RepID=L7LPG1_9ACTN|nr:hypothetical protein GSI01S_27_00510 [Gordonia sihwensis NBRC 108236]
MSAGSSAPPAERRAQGSPARILAVVAIIGSFERHPDLGCEGVVFLDEDSDACFQLLRDLPGGPRAGEYCVTTGASAPVYGGVVQWRRVGDDRFEFALAPRAARLFGDEVLSFRVVPGSGTTVAELAEHVERLLAGPGDYPGSRD